MSAEKVCVNCHTSKKLTAFRIRTRGAQAGELTAVCAECSQKANAARNQRRKRQREEEAPGAEGAVPGKRARNAQARDAGLMETEAFLALLRDADEGPVYLPVLDGRCGNAAFRMCGNAVDRTTAAATVNPCGFSHGPIRPGEGGPWGPSAPTERLRLSYQLLRDLHVVYNVVAVTWA